MLCVLWDPLKNSKPMKHLKRAQEIFEKRVCEKFELKKLRLKKIGL